MEKEEKEEKIVLKWMNDNIYGADCFRPSMIFEGIKAKIENEDTVVTICRRLHAKDLIEARTITASDPQKRNSCYRINQKGMDILNPNTRDKKMYKFAKIGTAAAIIAAIASVISIFT